MSVVLLNTETGERKIVADGIGSFKAPWRVEKRIVDKTEVSADHKIKVREMNARLAVWATSVGLPIPEFLDAARWLLKKDCPFCQLATQVLRRVEELGKERVRELIDRILEAKKGNDLGALQKLQEEFKKV